MSPDDRNLWWITSGVRKGWSVYDTHLYHDVHLCGPTISLSWIKNEFEGSLWYFGSWWLRRTVYACPRCSTHSCIHLYKAVSIELVPMFTNLFTCWAPGVRLLVIISDTTGTTISALPRTLFLGLLLYHLQQFDESNSGRYLKQQEWSWECCDFLLRDARK